MANLLCVDHRRAFRNLCQTHLRRGGGYITDEACRHLRGVVLRAKMTVPEEERKMDEITLRVLDLFPVRRITKQALHQFLRGIMGRGIGAPAQRANDGHQPRAPQERRGTFPAQGEEQYGFRQLLDQRQDENGLEFLVDWAPTWEPVTNIERAQVTEFQAMLRYQRHRKRGQ